MAMCSSLLFVSLAVVVAALACSSAQGRWVPTEEEDTELEEQLKKLNKPAVKTIQSSINGDLFDCVDIYKQPAFDDSLLKNHKLQLRPSSAFPEKQPESPSQSKSSGAKHSGYNDSCPAGTVLIRRASKADLIASKKIPNSFSGIHPAEENGSNTATYAAFLRTASSIFLGISADTTTWEIPTVERQSQFSASQVSIVKFSNLTGSHAIEVGWHVFPEMYSGDTRPHLFTRWTRDDFQTTGCFNLLCAGFVQTNDVIGPGSAIINVSHSVDAEKYLTIHVHKDPVTQNWWLRVNNNDIGYWPINLFDDLVAGEAIFFGGLVYSSTTQSSPPMGNGKFPGHESAYFRNVQFLNKTGDFYTPVNRDLDIREDLPDYYKAWKKLPTDDTFTAAYGGPGGYMPS